MSVGRRATAAAICATFAVLGASCSGGGGSTETSTSVTEVTTTTFAEGNVLSIAGATPEFSTLMDILEQTGLTDQVLAVTNFTVFAPTNEAFERNPELVDALLLPENQTQLITVLSYSITLQGQIPTSAMTDGQQIITAQTSAITVRIDGPDYFLIDGMGDEAKIVLPNIQGTDGMLQGIDNILLPPDFIMPAA